MNHVLTDAGRSRASIGTNAPIEQPFAAMVAGRRPRSPNILYLDAGLDAAQIGAYSGTDSTPQIDRLARSGVRFAAASADGSPGAFVPEVLREYGYDDGVFRLAAGARGTLDVDSALSFIGMRRSAPWSAYARLGGPPPEQVDIAVGRLVHALRRIGAYRHTVVAFVGAAAPGEALVPAILSWPGQIPPRQRHDGQVRVGDLASTVIETARFGAARALDLGGVDLTAHLFDGAPMPERPVRVVESSAA
ncbi:MAG: hypothetical protein L0K86_16970 [Actinomycetia bacterium]|nr:hypothetical protein [Actinomycetes bacterium]